MKRIVTMLLILGVLVLSLAGCGVSQQAATTGSSVSPTVSTAPAPTESTEKVTIHLATFTVGTDPGAEYFKWKNEQFLNSEAGKNIKIEVEEIPGADAYASKIQLLISSGALPDVVTSTGANYLDLAVNAGKVQDLTPYLDADPEWKAVIDPKNLEFNSRNGKAYAIPTAKQTDFIFYNSELLTSAGYSEFPTTWDDFFACCKALKAKGVTPVAMQTAEQGWLSSLWLSAFIATYDDNGNKWMNSFSPDTFETDAVKYGLDQVNRIHKEFTSSDAVGGNYDDGVGRFLNGDAAIIANGPWMIPDITDTSKAAAGLGDKVKLAYFPGQTVVNSPYYGEMIGATDPKVVEACIKYLKFSTSPEMEFEAYSRAGTIPDSPKVVIPDSFATEKPLYAAVLKLLTGAKASFCDTQSMWPMSTLEVLSKSWPEQVYGKISSAEFAKLLTEASKKVQTN